MNDVFVQQGNYGAHKRSYFDRGMAPSQSHAPVSVKSGPTEIDNTQSHSLQSNEGSPPPNSATTSGTASTSTSLGVSDKHQGSISSQFSQSASEKPVEEWSISVAEGMVSQPYDDTDTSQTVHAETADVPTSHTQEGKENPLPYQSAIKLLVSNNVAGSIIGRAGQTISDLQTQSSARIKLSQAGDYYPGTQDRVCLVQGQSDTVKRAVQLLLERLYMLQEQQHNKHLAWQPQKSTNSPTGFDFVVRFLVPSSSCGMIIGKAGANIKHMEESSGVSSVRLSPKESSDQAHQTTAVVPGTLERVVTLTGPSLESCVKCLFILIDGMLANHEISRYTNMTTSYSRHLVPGAYTPVQPGRPVHITPSPTGEWDTHGPYGAFMIKRSTSQPDLSNIQIEQQQRVQSRIPPESFGGGTSQISQREPPHQQFNPPFIDSPQLFNSEMPPTMQSLERGQQSNTPVAPMYLLGASAPNQLDHPPIQSSSSAPDLLALQLQDSLCISNSQAHGPVDYNHFAPQLPQPTPQGFSAQVVVPDTLIGSILGRGGRTLNDLQLHSNTRIRISQRGEYVPGTRNRIVTIRGQTAHSVSLAQYLMSQRMVVPPTATFSTQNPPVAPYLHHPSQHQPHHHRITMHQSPHTAALDSSKPSPPTASTQHQVLHETAFLPPGTHSTGAAASSLKLSLNTSDKDLTSHR